MSFSLRETERHRAEFKAHVSDSLDKLPQQEASHLPIYIMIGGDGRRMYYDAATL